MGAAPTRDSIFLEVSLSCTGDDKTSCELGHGFIVCIKHGRAAKARAKPCQISPQSRVSITRKNSVHEIIFILCTHSSSSGESQGGSLRKLRHQHTLSDFFHCCVLEFSSRAVRWMAEWAPAFCSTTSQQQD